MSTAMDEGTGESTDEQAAGGAQAAEADRTPAERDADDTGDVEAASDDETAVQGQGVRSPSRDQLFHVLRNRRRRFAIHHLKRATEPVDVGELATQIAAWENDVPSEAVTSQQRRRVYNALQQTHVPELEETGLVETDRRDVALTERVDALDVYLDVVENRDVPWSGYYLGLGTAGGVAAIVTAFDVGPFAAVPDVSAAAFLAVAVLVFAIAHRISQRRDLLGRDPRPPELRGE